MERDPESLLAMGPERLRYATGDYLCYARKYSQHAKLLWKRETCMGKCRPMHSDEVWKHHKATEKDKNRNPIIWVWLAQILWVQRIFFCKLAKIMWNQPHFS